MLHRRMLWLLVKGWVIGFSIAAPVGPIGLLVIRRTLAHGHATGLATGMGAALGDGTYGAVAALGMTAVSTLLLEHQGWIGLGGGLLLVGLGISIARSRPPQPASAPAAPISSIPAAFVSSYILTLTSPVTILIFLGLFASLSPAGDRPPALAESLLIVAGVFTGSAAWWLILSGFTARLRRWMTEPRMRWVNLASGLLIAGFGAVSIARETAGLRGG